MKDRQQIQGRGDERRQYIRHDASALPDVSAYIARGTHVRLIDISKRGALVETDSRLGPGRTVSLRFVTSDSELTLTGCVVRSSVSGLSGSELKFSTALSFNEDNPLCELLPEEQAPAAEDASDALANQESRTEPVLELVAAVHQSTQELRTMFAANDW